VGLAMRRLSHTEVDDENPIYFWMPANLCRVGSCPCSRHPLKAGSIRRLGARAWLHIKDVGEPMRRALQTRSSQKGSTIKCPITPAPWLSRVGCVGFALSRNHLPRCDQFRALRLSRGYSASITLSRIASPTHVRSSRNPRISVAYAALTSTRAAGKTAVIVVPAPKVLVTTTSPPCSRINERETGNPKPVPTC
jgi:hypothetical protein